MISHKWNVDLTLDACLSCSVVYTNVSSWKKGGEIIARSVCGML